MKKKITQLLASLLLILIVSSCNNEPNHMSAVQLNNGELWEANIETTQGIQQMQKLIKEHELQNKMEGIMTEASNSEKIENYHSINNELKKEFNLIIKSCSMDGEAHEQLHNYIKPMLGMFATIDGDNIELIERDYEALKAQLGAYSSYFR